MFASTSQKLRSQHCFLVFSRPYSVLSLQCEKEGEKMREGGRAGHLKIAPLEEVWVSITLRGYVTACSVNLGACVR